MSDYFLFADEANPEQTDPNKFFIYGGVIIPTNQFTAIHHAIEALRTEYSLDVGDQLKFNTRTKPAKISGKQHTELKSRVFEIAKVYGVKFCGYAILHAIARDKDHSTLVEFGANILLSKFNQFLNEEKSHGWATFDRLNTQTPYVYLQDKFTSRIKSEDSDIRLERILGYSFTCDGASHIASLADILIGGFRYIINEPERDIAGRTITQSLGPLFWGLQKTDGVNYVGDRGLVLRPKGIKSARYLAEYAEIRARLNDWSKAVSDTEA